MLNGDERRACEACGETVPAESNQSFRLPVAVMGGLWHRKAT
jgi:hypothetical protein